MYDLVTIASFIVLIGWVADQTSRGWSGHMPSPDLSSPEVGPAKRRLPRRTSRRSSGCWA